MSWMVGRRGMVGQLVGVLNEALGKDPMSECSGNQVKVFQRSLFTEHDGFGLDHRDIFGLKDSQDGSGGQ